MSNSKFSFLGIAAAVSIVLAVIVWQYDGGGKQVSASRGYLIQGLNPESVAEIVVQKGGEDVRLKRTNDGFAIVNKSMYPASTKEINELITACLDVKTVEVCTRDKANHKDLGVTEANSAEGVVRFLDSRGDVITGIVVGNVKDNGLSYARLVNNDDVWLVQSVPWIKQYAKDYLELELIAAGNQDIAKVEVISANGNYTLTTEPNSGKVVLESVAAGKKQKDSECEGVFNALSSLMFDDVNSAADMTDLKFDRQYKCLLKDSTLYTIAIAKKDLKTYIRCSAEFTDKEPVKKEQAVESQDALKKKETKLIAKEKAVKINSACEGWVYEIPEYKARIITRPVTELIEDIVRPADANVPAKENDAK